ncbi:MAG: hypothetical protein EXQ86_10250 [Rhodospirillales bacterium]|nr:hypothetical protein [Rhodospirillales bacterium]
MAAPDSPSTPRFNPSDVPDGTRKGFSLHVARLADGSVLRVAVNVVAGSGHHPCLALIAGIHGDEYDGILALAELWEELDPKDIAGRVVMVPCANPTAFAAGARKSPLDGLDLNRTFPGKPRGQPSEQLAYCLFHDVLKQADFVFSMHGWTAYGDVVPYVEFKHDNPATARASFDAAAASGFEIIRIGSWSPGVMTREASVAGIPGMESEVGGMGMSSSENRERYKGYVRRLMAHLGMVKKTTDARPAAAPRVVEHMDIFSPVGGVVRLRVRVGEDVTRGTVLATVHNFHGEARHEIIAPDSGMIAMTRVAGSAQPGDMMFRIFRDVKNPVAQ